MKILQSYIIETERLIFRIPTLEDIPSVFSATQFKGFNDGMLWEPPISPDELIEPHENVVKAWDEGSAFSFSLINKVDQEQLEVGFGILAFGPILFIRTKDI